jgi:hypothetical protein
MKSAMVASFNGASVNCPKHSPFSPSC